MNELDLQKLLCDVVNDAGGFAYKCNNRFMVGVVDLFVKLPDRPHARAPQGCAGFIEVKQRAFTDRFTNQAFTLDVTRPQHNFLKRVDAAGVPAGVASFMQKGTGSGLRLWLHLMTWRTASYHDNMGIKPYTTRWDAHIELGRKGECEGAMLSALYNWQKEWREDK